MKNNFKITVFCMLVLSVTGIKTGSVYAWVAGGPAYQTGAPQDNGTCNEKGCHDSFPLNSGTAIFSVNVPNTYTPGKAVNVRVSFVNSRGRLHGFQMTAVDANGNRVGTFKKTGNTTQVIRPNDEQGLDEEDRGKYIAQTKKGAKKERWKFRWIAPGSATNPVTFYATGAEADNDGTAANDYIYTTTEQITASSQD